jgi:hypothetical protein
VAGGHQCGLVHGGLLVPGRAAPAGHYAS